MQWTQVQVFTTTAGIEPLTGALMELDISGFSIRDAADFDEFLQGKQGRWDYIDQDLMALQTCETSVTFYLADTPQDQAKLRRTEETLARLRALDSQGAWGRLEAETVRLAEENWEESWKQYWHPTKMGKSLVVCPTWEDYAPAPGERVIRLDPGMAFGSGTHDSTRLCMELAEEQVGGGESVLDLGCGSGILAVTALVLGADQARGVDIGQVAVEVARENAALNGVADRCAFALGDLAKGITDTFDIVFANIVADIIVRLAPDAPRLLRPGGVLIASGIIDARVPEVCGALEAAGLTVKERRESGGWVALVAGRP